MQCEEALTTLDTARCMLEKRKKTNPMAERITEQSEWETVEEVIRRRYVHETAKTNLDKLHYVKKRDGETLQ